MFDLQGYFSTRSGAGVHFTDVARQHMQAHPGILNILQDLMMRVHLNKPDRTGRFTDQQSGLTGDTLGFQVDMGRQVGHSICVPAPFEQRCTFTRRANRDIPTRVVLGGLPKPTSTVIMWIRRFDESGRYEISTAYAGSFAPREPSDPYFTSPRTPMVQEEFDKALAFWRTHALIHQGDADTWQSSWEYELEKLGIL